MSKKRKPVYGVGINDANYRVAINEKVGGKWVHTWKCPFYDRWAEMLKRCYSANYHKNRPTYEDCTVCEEWILFSNFKIWMENQDWEGKHLDKDILFPENKIYSPETCIFIPDHVNSFITDSHGSRGSYPLGVTKKGKYEKYCARISNPFTTKTEHIGYFGTPEEAHLAWKVKKHEYACLLARDLEDNKVRLALIERYT